MMLIYSEIPIKFNKFLYPSLCIVIIKYHYYCDLIFMYLSINYLYVLLSFCILFISGTVTCYYILLTIKYIFK